MARPPSKGVKGGMSQMMQHHKLGTKEEDTIVRKIRMVRFILVWVWLTFRRSYRNIVMKVLSNVVLLRTFVHFLNRWQSQRMRPGKDTNLKVKDGKEFFESCKSCGNNSFSA